MVYISNIDTLKSVYFAYFHFEFFLGNCYNSGKIFTLENKIGRIMAGAHQQLGILPVTGQYVLSLMNSLSPVQKIHLYTMLIQRISTIIADQMPTYLVFTEVHSVLVSKCQTVYYPV